VIQERWNKWKRFREERPNLLMLYDIFHIKRDYKFWICHMVGLYRRYRGDMIEV